MTLLDLVQNIMSAFSLEEINSIEDVPEAGQISEIIKETYYDITAHRDWEFLNKTFSLVSSGDIDKPVLMKIPPNTSDVNFIKYLNEDTGEYEDIPYVSPEQFLELNNKVKVTDNVDVVTGMINQVDAKIKVKTDKQPTCYTSFDEDTIIFDSYNKKYDTTLQEHKSLCYGTKQVIFIVSDDYTIEMPEEMIWSYLLPEAKSVASIKLLQTVDSKEEQRSRRGRFRSYYSHPKTTDSYRLNSARYGRK